MPEAPTKDELEAANCWEPSDRVPGDPVMTAFRQRARLHQARWRVAKGHPIGSQPIAPRSGARSRPVGNRLPLDYARDTGANFVTAGARDAAARRSCTKEPHQSVDAQRVWADLLWSPALSFNLFGELAADLSLADRAAHRWWPEVPGTVSAVRFAHSPGWLDADYLGNLIHFDAAFTLDRNDGTKAVVAVQTKYHDRVTRHQPKPNRLPRYQAVMARSKSFARGAIDAVNGTDLLEMWLAHLLVLSMLQHSSGAWSWGRFVVVHAAGNRSYEDACARYRALLVDDSTFACTTVEALLDSGALPARAVKALRERYVVS